MQFGPFLAAKLLACSLLISAAPAPDFTRLPYDAEVLLAGPCLSPSLSGCRATPAEPAQAPASQALLGADSMPRLPVDYAGLFDVGPEVTAGTSLDAH